MMKELYSLFFSILLIVISGSCTPEDNFPFEENSSDENIPAVFFLDSVSIPKDEVVVAEATRTFWTSSSNRVSWSAGNEIGIYMRYPSGTPGPVDRSNVLHTVAAVGSSVALTTTSPLYFPDKGSNINFYAYYPYTASTSGLTVNYTLPQDQTSPAALGSADILYAKATANGTTPNITLDFSHQMALLSLNIQCSTLLGTGILKKVTVSGSKVTQTGTLELSTGTLTPSTTQTFSPFVSTSQPINTATSARVDIIINPCNITTTNPIDQLNVTLYFEGIAITQKTYKFALNSTSALNFEKGKRYTCTLNVQLPIMIL